MSLSPYACNKKKSLGTYKVLIRCCYGPSKRSWRQFCKYSSKHLFHYVNGSGYSKILNATISRILSMTNLWNECHEGLWPRCRMVGKADSPPIIEPVTPCMTMHRPGLLTLLQLYYIKQFALFDCFHLDRPVYVFVTSSSLWSGSARSPPVAFVIYHPPPGVLAFTTIEVTTFDLWISNGN